MDNNRHYNGHYVLTMFFLERLSKILVKEQENKYHRVSRKYKWSHNVCDLDRILSPEEEHSRTQHISTCNSVVYFVILITDFSSIDIFPAKVPWGVPFG